MLAERASGATLVVALLTGVLGGYGLTQLDSRFSLTDFVPQDSPALATLDTLEREFGGGFAETTEVLLEGPVATAAAHNALVDATAALGDVRGVADAGGRPDVDSPVGVIARAVAEPPELAATLAAAGLEPDLTVAPGTDVAALYGLVRDGVPTASEVLSAEGDPFIARAALRTTAGEDGAEALARDLGTAFAPVTAAGVDVTVTSPEIVQAVVRADIEDSQLTALALALAAAMLLLVVHFWVTARRPLLGAVTIAPVGLVLLWTFGMMALTGKTGGALAGSALTTMIGFGVLTQGLDDVGTARAQLREAVGDQLGFVAVYAIGFALVASLLVLPSLLRLWDRWDTRSARRLPGARAAGAQESAGATAATRRAAPQRRSASRPAGLQQR